MKRVYAWRGGKMVEIGRPAPVELHYVQPDFEEHGGRSKFRESLKRSESIEMGHSDMRNAAERWEKRKASFAERANRPVPGVRAAEFRESAPDMEMSRVNREVRNRLEGRPAPDRTTLIKMTLETARDAARNGRR